MAAPELLHSAPEIPRNLSELGQLFSPDSLQHLSTTLRSLGHPYGLLLRPHALAAQASKNNKPELSKLSSRTALYPFLLPLLLPPIASSEISFPNKDFDDWQTTSWCFGSIAASSLLSGIDIITPVGYSVAAPIASSSTALEILSGNRLLSDDERIDRLKNFVFEKEKDPELAKDTLNISWPISLYLSSWFSSFEYEAKNEGLKTPLTLLAPTLIKLTTRAEIPDQRSRQLRIAPYGISLGTTSLKLSTYRGQEPFTIKTPDGQPVTEIQPGSPLAALHVSHQAARFRRLSPLEKAHAIVTDVTQLLSAIDHTDPSTLSTDQQTTLVQAKYATIIGISHLVRLFRRQTGLPTWKLDVLPPLLQRFHALDSQTVSTQFGGKRKVRPEDVEMLVITPYQRRQLLADLQV